MVNVPLVGDQSDAGQGSARQMSDDACTTQIARVPPTSLRPEDAAARPTTRENGKQERQIERQIASKHDYAAFFAWPATPTTFEDLTKYKTSSSSSSSPCR